MVRRIILYFWGLFLLAARSNWKWFWNHPKAKVLSLCRGKKGAKFLFNFGIFLIALGIKGF